MLQSAAGITVCGIESDLKSVKCACYDFRSVY